MRASPTARARRLVVTATAVSATAVSLLAITAAAAPRHAPSGGPGTLPGKIFVAAPRRAPPGPTTSRRWPCPGLIAAG